MREAIERTLEKAIRDGFRTCRLTIETGGRVGAGSRFGRRNYDRARPGS